MKNFRSNLRNKLSNKKIKDTAIAKRIVSAYFALFCFFSFATSSDAIASSKIATGTTQLITDVTSWITGIALAVGGVCIIYFAVRRSGADEMDEKKWTNRIKVAIVSTIVAVLGSQILSTITSYYK